MGKHLNRELAEVGAVFAECIGVKHLEYGRSHRVYLDDFGTGYSRLANLQELSVDTIKIDRAFTSTVGTASVRVSLVPQILDMASAFVLGVVVEGIETLEQLEYFVAATPSCDGQGWFISRPLTLAQLTVFQKERFAPTPAERSALGSVAKFLGNCQWWW